MGEEKSTMRKHWSFSSWETFEQCPQKYSYKYVHGMKETPNRFAARGTEIHAMGEQYLLGSIKGVPDHFKDFSSELRGLKKVKAEAEQWASVTQDWKPAERGNAWIVSKLDARVRQPEVSHIIDFKSGKVYPDKHALQGSLYAAIEGALRPEIATVSVEFWYLEQNRVLSWKYTPEDVQKEQREWTVRGQGLQAAKEFPAKPSFLCKWCSFANFNGGPCAKAQKQR